MADIIHLAGHQIVQGHCFIIAEAGVNHNGSLKMACQLVDTAIAAGADAIKFQTFQAETLVTAQAPKAEYQKRTAKFDESQLEMLKRLELPRQVFNELFQYCQTQGINFLSTPFDRDSADFLEQLGMPAFKIPSGELIDLSYLKHIAEKKKPMIVSTGMANLGEVEDAISAIRSTGNTQIILLHCVSDYPADPADANLRAMRTLRIAFDVPVGYSDHTLGIEVALAAVALGACVIEKHFTLDRNLSGPDHRSSLEPDELVAMITGIRKVEAALGSGRKEPANSEAKIAAVARRSLVAAHDIQAGTVLTEELIAIRRPGIGLPPGFLPYLLGRKLKLALTAGTLITLEVLE